MRRGARLYRRAAALGRHRIKSSGPDSDHLFGICRLHGRDHVARIDGPREGVSTLNGENVGDLTDVEQRRHARHNVFAVRRRRSQKVVIVSA